jgi:hypothetical protein
MSAMDLLPMYDLKRKIKIRFIDQNLKCLIYVSNNDPSLIKRSG